MPIPEAFRRRLYPNLAEIAAHFGTPFHIYDEVGIRQTVRELYAAFDGLGFQEFFAVKALPNPHILRILSQEGCGFDCSSVPELILARQSGAQPGDIFFTSNNTTRAEFAVAQADGGAYLNLDDISLLDRIPTQPEIIAFRMNPGSDMGNAIIGKPEVSKFGIPREKLVDAYRLAQAQGIRRFGLHQMVVSNERDAEVLLASAQLLHDVACQLKSELGITLEFTNIGGGLGIPYEPNHKPLNLPQLAAGIRELWRDFPDTRLFMESGRYVTGPQGVLVTRVINIKDSYRRYIGVDASMPALMRPGMYGAYHHIDVYDAAPDSPQEMVDIVGSLCENNDKFAMQRPLPTVNLGDLLVIQDTGAHGYSMGFNYNGRLRPQELLLRADGIIERIRRPETLSDYFATLDHVAPDPFEPPRTPLN
ncbi:MAG: diaminopimelate decarboxylase [Anaerolineaceae bacterium]|nr:diaminopimelate decarboxylase [Anaerolineaceae bacterium]